MRVLVTIADCDSTVLLQFLEAKRGLLTYEIERRQSAAERSVDELAEEGNVRYMGTKRVQGLKEAGINTLGDLCGAEEETVRAGLNIQEDCLVIRRIDRYLKSQGLRGLKFVTQDW